MEGAGPKAPPTKIAPPAKLEPPTRLTLDGDELALRWAPPAEGAASFLYLHGFGSSQDGEKAGYFRRRAAAAGLGFCSLDFRGHGLSGGGLGDLTFSRNLADAGAALAWLGERGVGGDGSPLVVFGSSMGGATGLWLAARHPGAFAAGLAIAPALGMERALEERLGEEGIANWRRTGRQRFVNELVDDELGWELMADLASYRAAELPPLHVTPTLVFQGMGDDSVDWRLAVDLARSVAEHAAGTGDGAGEGLRRRVEVHLFSAGDHRLLDQRPRMWEMAMGFLGQLGLVAGGG